MLGAIFYTVPDLKHRDEGSQDERDALISHVDSASQYISSLDCFCSWLEVSIFREEFSKKRHCTGRGALTYHCPNLHPAW